MWRKIEEINGNLFSRKFLCDQPQLLIFGFGSVRRVFSEIIDQTQPDFIRPYLANYALDRPTIKTFNVLCGMLYNLAKIDSHDSTYIVIS